MIQETFLPRLFFRKKKIPHIHCRSSKYNAGQEIRIWPHESSDFRKHKIPKLLIRSVTVGVAFSNANQLLVFRD